MPPLARLDDLIVLLLVHVVLHDFVVQFVPLVQYKLSCRRVEPNEPTINSPPQPNLPTSRYDSVHICIGLSSHRPHKMVVVGMLNIDENEGQRMNDRWLEWLQMEAVMMAAA